MRFLALLVALCSMVTAASAFASNPPGELDNEGQAINVAQRALAADLPATLVVRINQITGEASVLQSPTALTADTASISALKASAFIVVSAKDQIKGSELDQDSSTNSWFFYFNNFNFYNPCFYSGGYNFYYQNYYWNNFGGYNYYYYRWY